MATATSQFKVVTVAAAEDINSTTGPGWAAGAEAVWTITAGVAEASEEIPAMDMVGEEWMDTVEVGAVATEAAEEDTVDTAAVGIIGWDAL